MLGLSHRGRLLVVSEGRVGLIADHEIRDQRISRAERVGPHRVSHHVLVRSLDDVDAQLLAWLADAQAMQAGEVEHNAGQHTPLDGSAIHDAIITVCCRWAALRTQLRRIY